MAGPSAGAALAQGAAAGFQGQQLGLDSVIRQLQARAVEQELQQRASQQAGQGVYGKAIMDLFGGQQPGGGASPMPVSPGPGAPSVPMAPAGGAPMPTPAAAPDMTGPVRPGDSAPGGATFVGGDRGESTNWAMPPQAPQAAPGAPPGAGGPAGAPGPQRGVGGVQIPGTGTSPALAVLQGRQPELTWGNVVQAIRRNAPGAPPDVLAAAVDKFAPMMSHQQQNQWEQIKFGMQLYEKRLEWEERARQADERAQQYGDRTAEQAFWHAQATAEMARAHQAGEALRGMGQQMNLLIAHLSDQRARDIAAGHDKTRTEVAAGHDNTRTAIADQTDQRQRDLAEAAATGGLTSEQKILVDQRHQLTTQLNALNAPNSPRSKMLQNQIADVDRKLAGVATAPAGPRQPSANTIPVPPAGLAGRPLQYNPATRQWRDKGSSEIFDAQGNPVK